MLIMHNHFVKTVALMKMNYKFISPVAKYDLWCSCSDVVLLIELVSWNCALRYGTLWLSTSKILHDHAHSQGSPRGMMHLPKSAQRSTFGGKMGEKLGVCKRVKGVRFKKSTFWVKKLHILGVLHPLKIDPGYQPVHDICKWSILLWFKSSQNELFLRITSFKNFSNLTY